MLRRAGTSFAIASRWFADLSLGMLLVGAFVTLAVVDERKSRALVNVVKPSSVPVAGALPPTLARKLVKAAAAPPNPGRLEDFAKWPAGEPLNSGDGQSALAGASVRELLPPQLLSRKPGPRGANSVSLKTYRTLCVRTCDGFFWQMSYAVPKLALGFDSNACEASCSSEAKLFVTENKPGEIGADSPQSTTDLNGEPYSKLPNAYRYRRDYIPGCGCHANPWEQAALDRHARFASLELAGSLAQTLAADDKARVAKLREVPAHVVTLIGGETAARGPGNVIYAGKKHGKKKSYVTTRIVVTGNSVIQILGLIGQPASASTGQRRLNQAKIRRINTVKGSIFQQFNSQR